MKKVLILIVLVLMFSIAFAEDYSEDVVKRTDWIMKSYTKELDLSEEQIKNIRPIILERTAFMEKNRPGKNATRDERFKALKKFREEKSEYDKRVIEHLDKEQIKKFSKMQDKRRDAFHNVRKRDNRR